METALPETVVTATELFQEDPVSTDEVEASRPQFVCWEMVVRIVGERTSSGFPHMEILQEKIVTESS